MRRRFLRSTGKTKREEIDMRNRMTMFYASASPKPDAMERARASLIPLPKERAPRRASAKPLEKHILSAVLQALRRDPRVATAERQQSGVFREGNRWIRVGTPGALDIKGMLKGGLAYE